MRGTMPMAYAQCAPQETSHITGFIVAVILAETNKPAFCVKVVCQLVSNVQLAEELHRSKYEPR